MQIIRIDTNRNQHLTATTEPISYISSVKASKKLGITSRRLRVLAKAGRVNGAVYHPLKGWQFPKSDIQIAAGKRGPQSTYKDKKYTQPSAPL